jgi:MFS family permease
MKPKYAKAGLMPFTKICDLLLRGEGRHLIDMETLQTRLRNNIPKVYIYAFFLNFLVMIPVLVPYWQSLGLTLREIFLLQGIFGGALVVCDAPAGYVADLLGRKRVLVTGATICALAFQILWFGKTFFDFAVMELLLGIGLSLESGCDIAILYSALEKTDYSGSRTKTLGMRMTLATLGEGVAALLCALLSAYSLKAPIYANAIAGCLPALAAATLYDDGQRLQGSHVNNFKLIGRALFGHSRLLTLIIVNLVFYGFATYCAVWSMAPYWASRGIPITMFGFLWAINNFMVALVSRFAHAIEEKLGAFVCVLTVVLMPIVGYMGMGWVGGIAGILFILAFPICRGLNQVLLQHAVNARVPAEIRATTNSIGSLGMRMLFLIFGPLLGAALDKHGPDHAMRIMGWVYVAGFFAIALPLLMQRRQFRKN